MEEKADFEKVRGLIRSLLGPEGCPWDKRQTPKSLCDYIIEESFELVEAIRSGNHDEAREELGDVLFLILFAAELFEREGRFTMNDVIDTNVAKMVRRHPHVFAETEIGDQSEILRNWERIKREEKTTEAKGVPGLYDTLPKGLPPMLRAYRIHSKAARMGFTWESDDAVLEEISSEWHEWLESLDQDDREAQEAEFGDFLFTLIEYGRRKGLKGNAALDMANQKFLRRFHAMEEMARGKGKELHEFSLHEMNEFWDKVKGAEEYE